MRALVYFFEPETDLALRVRDVLVESGARVGMRNANYYLGEVEPCTGVAVSDSCSRVADAYGKAGIEVVYFSDILNDTATDTEPEAEGKPGGGTDQAAQQEQGGEAEGAARDGASDGDSALPDGYMAKHRGGGKWRALVNGDPLQDTTPESEPCDILFESKGEAVAALRAHAAQQQAASE